MKRRGEEILLPDNPVPHLVEWLFEIGPTEPTSMGDAPLSWREIDAWCARTGIDLDPWESRTIRRLSAAFVGERYKARKPDCPAPWSAAAVVDEAAQEARVTAQFKAMMLAFAKPAG